MKKQPRYINTERRRFMQNSAVAGGAAAAGVAVVNAQAASDDNAAELIEATSQHAGYQLTDRVKEYYRKARF